METFGVDGQPGSYDDFDLADAILQVGHNVAVAADRALDAHARPPGAARSRRSSSSSTRAPPRRPGRPTSTCAPGRDERRRDERPAPPVIEAGRIDRRVHRPPHGRASRSCAKTVAAYTPERVEEIDGRPGRAAPRAPPRSSARPGGWCRAVLQGVYQSNQATAAACQVNNLHLIRGLIGKPGCGVLQMNGQPTAAEHPRERCRRRAARLPQLGEPGPHRRAGPALERRAGHDPALGAADARDGDLPATRDGLDRVPLDHRHQPGRLDARAAAGSARSSTRRVSSWSCRTPS